MQILYGLGNVKVESYFRKQLGDEYIEVGAVTHRLAILDKMSTAFTAASEAVVVLNEGLPNKQEISLLDLVKQIRQTYPHVRIVVLAGNHEPGDTFLATLISMGVYDIEYGESCDVNAVLNLVKNPNTYADVVNLLKPVSYAGVQEMQKPVMTAVVSNTDASSDKSEDLTKNDEQRIFPKKIKTPVSVSKDDSDQVADVEYSPLVVKTSQVPAVKRKSGLKKQKRQRNYFGPTKIISFCSCCAGMGNRETALSVACSLAAKGEKVVLLDCTADSPLLLSRLDFRNPSNGIHGAVREIKQGKITNNLYTPSIDVRNPDAQRLSKIPNSLSFLTYVMEDDNYNITVDELEAIITLLKTDGTYNSIVVCCSHASDSILERIIGFSTLPHIVTTQSSFVFRFVEDVSSKMDLSSVKLLFNKFEKNMQPDIKTGKQVLGVSDVLTIPCDNRGFLMADSCALPYPLIKTSGKVNKAIDVIIQSLQKGV